MNIEDDPRLTAYALGELVDEENEIFVQELANAGGAEPQLAQIRACTQRVRAAYETEPDYALTADQRAILLSDAGAIAQPGMIGVEEIEHSDKVLPWVTQPVISEVDKQAIAEKLKPSFWRKAAPALGSLGIAAGVIWLAAVVITHRPPSKVSSPEVVQSPEVEEPLIITYLPNAPDGNLSDWATRRAVAASKQAPFRYGSAINSAAPGVLAEGFRDPMLTDERRSAMPVLATQETYENLRELMTAETMPSADQIRVGELINAFEFGYSEPVGGESFAVDAELASCPWAPSHQLLQIGVRSADPTQQSGDNTLAEDVQMAVEFNPAQVAGYRLLGEPELQEQAKDHSGVSVAAGHTVTALYEVVPREAAGGAQDVSSEEMLTVRVDYRDSDGQKPETVEEAFKKPEAPSWRDASNDLRFAASVAGYGLLLGGEKNERLPTYDLVLQLARDAVGEDADGKRAEFVEWIEKTIEMQDEESSSGK